ncbi:methyltransferase [Streptomyces agglomeratus]|uniref:methyltransferase n=1 Tax=Streptomyces agglomeratus TaxID=285458 RepID=UPI0008547770|nr:methyltransferase [Streptomyces agglomeratus]OEJ37848.1 methyltransferase [Streptomyces agglomeratus]OEJ47767.1 methyltransferase [Streptomyces agglomeratus]OEJ50384.1 methyltransferase [Streptomyces agglomeratus]
MSGRPPTRNDDVDWDRWPVEDYLAENYRELHPSDAAVIAHHSAFYRRFAAGGVARSVEFGAGPNLYPLMLAVAASRRIDAVEAGASGVAYLTRQLDRGPDDSWQPFYALCRRLNPGLPATAEEALARVRVVHADVRDLTPGTYGAASMSFVAEGVTEDRGEFTDFCRHFVRSVVPGGHLVAAFMENMPTYRIGPASRWPGCPVDPAVVTEVFRPLTRRLSVGRIDADPTLPDYGDSGMVLLTAVR